MRLPVTLYVCDMCESVSAISSSSDRPPVGWVDIGGRQWCHECIDEAERATNFPPPTGVVLSPQERCP